MAEISFSEEEKTILVNKIQQYFAKELDQDLGQFDAQFLLDFFSEQVGSYFYNKGVFDAKALLEDKIDSITESFYEIEKPTEFYK